MEQMTDHKPLAYYDPLHDKLLWAESPQYVHAQSVKGMSLKPLYLHPPTCPKNPMDGDAILEGFEATGFDGKNFKLRCFIEGVRWAEEYHGIGGGDE